MTVGQGVSSIVSSTFADRIVGRTVKARLLRLVALLGVLWAVCLAVAANGLSSTNASAGHANAMFDAFQVERTAYEGWLTADDQMNMYTALASLHDRTQQ